MAKPNINSDRDNGTNGELLTRLDNQSEYDRILALSKPEIDLSEARPAQSFWSTGRGCPKCKGLLKMRELNQDSGYLSIYCGSCGAIYDADDIENTSEIGDKIHRQIPEELVMRYMTANGRLWEDTLYEPPIPEPTPEPVLPDEPDEDTPDTSEEEEADTPLTPEENEEELLEPNYEFDEYGNRVELE